MAINGEGGIFLAPADKAASSSGGSGVSVEGGGVEGNPNLEDLDPRSAYPELELFDVLKRDAYAALPESKQRRIQDYNNALQEDYQRRKRAASG